MSLTGEALKATVPAGIEGLDAVVRPLALLSLSLFLLSEERGLCNVSLPFFEEESLGDAFRLEDVFSLSGPFARPSLFCDIFLASSFRSADETFEAVRRGMRLWEPACWTESSSAVIELELCADGGWEGQSSERESSHWSIISILRSSKDRPLGTLHRNKLARSV